MMTVDALATEPPPADSDVSDAWESSIERNSAIDAQSTDRTNLGLSAEGMPRKAPAKKSAGKKIKTLELTLTVTGTADGEWRAELKQGASYLARNLTVAAAAVSRAAPKGATHEDLSNPIDQVIEEARSQQAAKVAALEAELDAARRALADLD